ncbi:MAG TPA: sigma-70 family RNA polymerase sigma factor [Blastocatellia bacterium]|nr:sigma-70 family RNA polymerase sigma factor [Blastocatellia bacterium]
MMSHPIHSVTQILRDWTGGDQSAFERLVPLVEGELRRQAARYLRMEQPGHTLQTADLIQEAYLRLIDARNIQWQNRAHFFGIAANLMRRILVDYARKRHAQKRDWTRIRAVPTEAQSAVTDHTVDLIALNVALDRLTLIDPRQARIVELRYFAGLSVEETAQVLEISARTVERDWLVAKIWLREEIGRNSDHSEMGPS